MFWNMVVLRLLPKNSIHRSPSTTTAKQSQSNKGIIQPLSQNREDPTPRAGFSEYVAFRRIPKRRAGTEMNAPAVDRDSPCLVYAVAQSVRQYG